MPDILDSYISKIDTGDISKKINHYISSIKLRRDRIIKILFSSNPKIESR